MAAPADKALDEVYLGDFEGFVSRRDALAKRLKADGDAEAADGVKALKKPSRTAWAVNQFSAHGKKLRTELLKAGAALRESQEDLVSGDADRTTMLKARDRERAAVSGALEAIGALAKDAGGELNAAATERVRQTLHAVALDDDVREQFEAGRLTSDHEASGLGGGFAAGAAPAKGGGKRDSAAARKRNEQADQKRRRREELKAAEADATRRDRELEAAEAELDEAKQAAKRAQGDLKRATRARDGARDAADEAARRRDELRAG